MVQVIPSINSRKAKGNPHNAPHLQRNKALFRDHEPPLSLNQAFLGGPYFLGGVALGEYTWMSQEVSKWLLSGFITPIDPIYK